LKPAVFIWCKSFHHGQHLRIVSILVLNALVCLPLLQLIRIFLFFVLIQSFFFVTILPVVIFITFIVVVLAVCLIVYKTVPFAPTCDWFCWFVL